MERRVDMKNFRISPIVLRALVAVLLLAAALGTASVPADASSNCTFYNNAAHSQVVGQIGYDCCNNYIQWGTTSAYKVCSTACFICYPPPR
jgi:hypothetical protein